MLGLKYRVWSKKLNRMIYQSFEDLLLGIGWDQVDDETENFVQTLWSQELEGFDKNVEVMKFIGKQDKNKKDIYTGDIIKWVIKGYAMGGSYLSPDIGCASNDEIEIIVIGDDLTNIPNFVKYTMMGSIPRESTIEIIGNKYENEELYNETIK
jgi:uncharacterized phage protein (TIGR01671 family)